MNIHESLTPTDDAQFTIETTADVIKPIVAYANKAYDELKVHVTEAGIHYDVVDSANVAMAGIDVLAGAFEDYEVDETTIGINLKEVNKALRAGRQRQSDNVVLSYQNEMLATTIQRDYDGMEMDLQNRIHTIDPDAIRSEPEFPEIELTNSATVPRSLFNDAVDAANDVSDHIRIAAEDGDLVISAEGDLNSSTGIVSDVDAGTTEGSMFSLDYFRDLTDALAAVGVDTVTLRFAEEYPIRIEWETEMNETTVAGYWFQAPRIQSD